MSKRVKRWRLSDVVHAMSRAAGDDAAWSTFLRREAAMSARNHGVSATLRGWDYTLPGLLGRKPSEWSAMSDAEREALVVAEARRLKVPRRA